MKKILAFCLLFTVPAIADTAYMHTPSQQVWWFRPDPVSVGGGTYWSPTDARLHEAGFVFVEYDAAVPFENRVITWDPPAIRAMTQEEIEARAAAEAAEAAAARQAHFETLAPMAVVYRIVMERNFGIGACTNRAVTETYVTTYFSTKLALGTLTSLEGSDSLFLLDNTPKIMGFTGDGTIWTFPWSQVPEPGQ